MTDHSPRIGCMKILMPFRTLLWSTYKAWDVVCKICDIQTTWPVGCDIAVYDRRRLDRTSKADNSIAISPSIIT